MLVRYTRDFNEWLEKLKDNEARLRIVRQVERIRRAGAYIGDWKALGLRIVETRIMCGPGYRFYSVMEGGTLLLLLCGGDKSSQQRDIAKAKALYAEWRRGHGNV